jgi:hypothetical protein
MSNETQKTGVDYIVEQVEDFIGLIPVDIIEKAKEIEKQQNLNYLKSYFEWHKSMGFVSHKPEDIIEFKKQNK